MSEIISNSCQTLIQLVSKSELHNLVYLSLFLITLAACLVFIKVVSIYFFSQRLSQKLENHIPPTKKLSVVLKKLDLEYKTYLVGSDKLFAFCFGFISPKIYISSSMVSVANRPELEAVLRHEQYHLLHKDTFIMFGISIIKFVLAFVPGAANFVRNININLEIKADIYAAKSLGEKRPLLSIMKKVLKKPQSTNFSFIPAIGTCDTLGPRIYALTNQGFKNKRTGITSIIFGIFILVILILAVMTPVYAHEIYDKKETGVICPEITQQNASYPYTPAH